MDGDSPQDYSPFSRELRPWWGVAFRWFLVAVVLAVALAIVFGLLGLLLGWFNAGKNVIGPQNVTTQYRDAYTRFESLKATACNVKDARTLANSSADPDVKAQREQQTIAYEQNYRRIAAQYDAAYDNAFQAKHVGPRDLPRPAPALNQAITSYCS